MGDFGWIIIVAIGWMVFGTAREIKKAAAAAAGNARRNPAGARTSRSAAEAISASRNADLREALWALEEARALTTRREAQPEFVEDLTSLEQVVVRAERQEIDHDAASIEAARRRRAAAERRNTGRGAGDHAAFDARIRQEPVDHTAVALDNPRTIRLREAFIWREVLGPPVSMRDEA